MGFSIEAPKLLVLPGDQPCMGSGFSMVSLNGISNVKDSVLNLSPILHTNKLNLATIVPWQWTWGHSLCNSIYCSETLVRTPPYTPMKQMQILQGNGTREVVRAVTD